METSSHYGILHNNLYSPLILLKMFSIFTLNGFLYFLYIYSFFYLLKFSFNGFSFCFQFRTIRPDFALPQ